MPVICNALNFFFYRLEDPEATRDAKGRYFIDRPSQPFKCILSWMQTGELCIPPEEGKKKELERELEFYGLLEQCDDYFHPVHKSQSCICGPSKFSKLKEWYLQDKNVTLLYRGSEHGFSAKSFHERCDNKGATLTVLKTSKGHIFGGYCTASWSSDARGVNDVTASVFSLKGPLGERQFKIVHTAHNSIYRQHFPTHFFFYNIFFAEFLPSPIEDHPDLLPTFGSSHDLCIASECNKNHDSYSHPTGTFYIGGYLDGASRFTVSEIEVFKVSVF